MNVPTKPEIDMHFMAFKTDWLENVGDDHYNLVQFTVDNGDFKSRKLTTQVRVLEASADVNALAFGGLVVFSNLKKPMIKKAVMLGLEYLVRSGQLRVEDLMNHVAAEADPNQEASN